MRGLYKTCGFFEHGGQGCSGSRTNMVVSGNWVKGYGPVPPGLEDVSLGSGTDDQLISSPNVTPTMVEGSALPSAKGVIKVGSEEVVKMIEGSMVEAPLPVQNFKERG